MPLPSFSFRSLRSCSRKRQRSELTLRFPFPRSPIFRDGAKHATPTLPYEILQVIFSIAMEASSSDIDLAEKALLRANILSFSQVCGQWRYAARGYSVLWVHSINFQRHPPEAIAHYLRLSRPRPIDVGHRSAPLRISGDQGRVTLNTLKMDAHRVRQWNIRLASDFQYMNLQFLFGLPNDTASYPAHTLRQTGIANLPYYRWKSLVSSLERLSLCDTNLVLIPSMELSNITELSIVSIHHRSIKYRIMEMVALLRKVPRLQFLRLENAIGLGPGDNPITANQPIPPVILPDLRIASLLETGWETAYLLLLLVPILQKPDHCGIDLSLPSFSGLEYVRTPVNEIIRALLLVQQSIRESWLPQSATTPRVELAFKSRWYRGCQFTMGTVPTPEETLDWNGNSGTLGVKQYLDNYFDPPSLAPFEVLHPPLNVSLYNPNATDIWVTACLLNGEALSTTQSVRITMKLSATSWKSHGERVGRHVATVLRFMRHVTTMTLDEEACVVVLNSLHDKTYLDSAQTPWPVPYLPNLKFIAIESMRERAEEEEHSIDEMRARTLRLITKQYVEWRKRVGYPVEVVWAGSVVDTAGGVTRGRGTKSRRNGMVSMPMRAVQ